MKTPKQVAEFFGCTEEQARAHMRLNAMQLREMGEKARRAKSGKFRGFTTAELYQKAAEIDAAINK